MIYEGVLAYKLRCERIVRYLLVSGCQIGTYKLFQSLIIAIFPHTPEGSNVRHSILSYPRALCHPSHQQHVA